MKKEIAFGLALTVFGAPLWAGLADSAGQIVDKSAIGAKTGTDSGETKTNAAITQKAGDNVITQTAKGHVSKGAKKTKKGTDTGAARVKKSIGVAGTIEGKATTDLQNATAK